MASITTRNDRFCVIYPYVDDKGNRRQKWETFQTLQEAKARKAEIEYSQQLGTFTIPNCTTVSELLSEYVSLYGKPSGLYLHTPRTQRLLRTILSPIWGT